ncbi:MAG: tRNA (adenosine(37)-N6)-threonylcarbamoyltransferase complex dimerization subunit type 1 TsaB [Phycisphaerae bacterium]
MEHPVSIAIETSGPSGGVALGFGDELERSATFPARGRHATQLIRHMDELLKALSLQPKDLEELYVSVGPGSFTGLRIGVTVARTLAQAVSHLQCVAVPTAAAVAENSLDLCREHLAVVFEARDELLYATIFTRRDDRPVAVDTPKVAKLPEVLAEAPRPLVLVGGCVNSDDIDDEQVTIAEPARATPTAEGVWRAGRRAAREGAFTDPFQLLPIYARRPEAERLWDKRHGR